MYALVDTGRCDRRLLGLLSEVRPSDAFLEVLERTEVLDDVSSGVVEKYFAAFVAPYCDEPVEVVAILNQVVDGLRNAFARDDRNLWLQRF